MRGFWGHYLFRTAWLIALSCACCAGCGRSRNEPLPVYPVSGEIFVGGKPAEGAVIAFHPIHRTEWAAVTSRGVVSREGRFSLTTYAANDGAPEGNYVITVYWPERLLDPSGEGDSLPADKLGARFTKSSQSNLRAILGPRPVTLARVNLRDQAVWQGREFHFVEQKP